MKINLVSDIHLETYDWFPKFSARKATQMFNGLFSCDVLVLAGDIVSSPRMLTEWLETSPVPVVYLLGNHEYYGKSFDNTPNVFRTVLQKLSHVHLLDRDTVTINGVKFIGTTLWTDFDKKNPLAMEMARRSINDFRKIDGCTVDSMLERHEMERSWLERELAGNKTSPASTVVVTHFGPSILSQHSSWPNSLLGKYFVSSLDDIIERYAPSTWIHGHTHDSCDYRIFDTRVVSNQSGYAWEFREKQKVEQLVDFYKGVAETIKIPVMSVDVPENNKTKTMENENGGR
jgi:Icc-related predicted phosphoesterase